MEIPSSAVVVSDWESLHEEGAKYPEAALVYKYGGWVIEVDSVIVLAVEGSLSQEITDKDPEAVEEDQDCELVEENDELNNKVVKRCSHARCFTSATCRTYSHCYVCRIYNYTTGFGNCI